MYYRFTFECKNANKIIGKKKHLNNNAKPNLKPSQTPLVHKTGTDTDQSLFAQCPPDKDALIQIASYL